MFVRNRPRMDVVALLVIAVLPFTGVVTIGEAIAGVILVPLLLPLWITIDTPEEANGNAIPSSCSVGSRHRGVPA